MRLLVTGAAGFLGRHLTKAASKLGEVLSVQRSDLDGGAIVADLSGAEETQLLFDRYRPDVVLHAAARIPQSPDDDIFRFFDDNVRATVNIYQAARKTGVRRIVLSSSMSVYGPPQYLPVDENHPAVPDFAYALSKIQAELVGRCFAESGIETTVLRYSGIFGAGQRSGAVPAFITRSLQNAPMSLNAGGRPSSDFVWVQDVVRSNILAASWPQPTRFEVLNIGSGVEFSLLRLAETIRDLCKSQSAINPIDSPAPRDFRFAYNISQAREKLGFVPTPVEVALQECIRQKQEGQF